MLNTKGTLWKQFSAFVPFPAMWRNLLVRTMFFGAEISRIPSGCRIVSNHSVQCIRA